MLLAYLLIRRRIPELANLSKGLFGDGDLVLTIRFIQYSTSTAKHVLTNKVEIVCRSMEEAAVDEQRVVRRDEQRRVAWKTSHQHRVLRMRVPSRSHTIPPAQPSAESFS